MKNPPANAGDVGLIPGSGCQPICSFKRTLDHVAMPRLGVHSLALLLGMHMAISYAYHVVTLVAQMVKNLPAMQETWVRSLGWEDPLDRAFQEAL